MDPSPAPAYPSLHPHEPLGPGVLRVATGLLDAVLDRIEAGTGDRSEDVHQIRTGLKRLRALVRLVEPAMTKRAAAAELEVFRDAGRHFAAARDGYILVHTLETLSTDLRRGDGHPVLRATIGRLREENAAAVAAILDERDAGSRAVVAGLREARQRWATGTDGLLAGGLVPDELVAGFRRTYRRGRKALERARAGTTAENLHAWRRRVKDLDYQLEIIGPIAPEVAHLEEPIGTLAGLLGEDHDLAGLKAAVDAGAVDGTGTEALLSGLARRRTELQQRAFDLGSAVYRADPDKFVAHLSGLPAVR
jgi:CHAD domain-containing protein